MTNIVQLQKQLETLPDQALVQYMQQPPGNVPQYLVLTELGRRKRLRDSAATMQQGPQQAPSTTVKDDLLQSGIAALPAHSPEAEEAYAKGGIVAFAGGGDVDEDRVRSNRNPYSVIQQRAAANPLGNLQDMWAAAGGNKTAPVDLDDKFDLIQRHTRDVDYDGAAPPSLAPYQANPLQSAPYVPSPAYPAGQSPVAVPSAAGAPRAQRAPSAGGIASLSGASRTKTKTPVGGAAPEADTGYKPLSDEERMRQVQTWLDRIGTKGEFDDDKARLAEAQEELRGKKKDNVNQALIQAGLGIMAGRSQYALTNIGEGAMQGLAYLQKANQADALEKRALLQAQSDLTRAEAAARRGDQQTAILLQGQGEKAQQTAVQLRQERENYLLAHQDRQAQIDATLKAASMRVAAGGGSRSDKLLLDAEKAAANEEAKWRAAAAKNPEYMINPAKMEQDAANVRARARAVFLQAVGAQAPAMPAAPQATMMYDPKSKKLVPIQ